MQRARDVARQSFSVVQTPPSRIAAGHAAQIGGKGIHSLHHGAFPKSSKTLPGMARFARRSSAFAPRPPRLRMIWKSSPFQEYGGADPSNDR